MNRIGKRFASVLAAGLLVSLLPLSACANAGLDKALTDILLRPIVDITLQMLLGPKPPPPPAQSVPAQLNTLPQPQTVALVPAAGVATASDVVPPIDMNTRLKDQQLYRATPPMRDELRTRTFFRSFFTLLGGSARNAADLRHQDDLDDPAPAVSQNLSAAMQQRYTVHDAGTVAADGEGVGPVSGLVLEVETTHWELKSVSINPLHIFSGIRHYGIYYHAKFRLTDQHAGTVVAFGECDESPDREGAPTYDEAIADHGALMKQLLQQVATRCAQDIESDYLQFPPPIGAL